MRLEGSREYLDTDEAGRAATKADLQLELANKVGVHVDMLSLPYYSDLCVSGNALLVDGNDFVAYGVMAEHTHRDIAVWNGELSVVHAHADSFRVLIRAWACGMASTGMVRSQRRLNQP